MAELANRSDEQTLPSQLILSNAAKIAIKEDKPIMLDYWTASLEKKVIIGVRENQEKLLVKYKTILDDWAKSYEKKKFFVTKEDIYEVISSRTGIPVGNLTERESELLINLKVYFAEIQINRLPYLLCFLIFSSFLCRL